MPRTKQIIYVNDSAKNYKSKRFHENVGCFAIYFCCKHKSRNNEKM